MADRNLATTLTIGGAVSTALGSALRGAKRQISELGTVVRTLEDRQKRLRAATGDNSEAYRRLTSQVNRLREAKSRLAQVERQRQQNLARREELRGQMGDALAIGATIALPVVQAAQFERSMLGVAKQVEGARDASGQLTDVYFAMRQQIFELGRELPLATGDIAEMVAAGARMGVAKDALIDFTRTSAMMASAFELPAGELAEQMGKVANLFAIPITNVGQLADSINFLDDNAQSKGGDIIEVLQRIAGQAQTLRMSATDAAALGSTFLSLGASAEIAATGANAVMRELAIASMQPKRFQEGLSSIGMDAVDVQMRMANDPTGTILSVMDALNKLPDESRLEATTRLFGKEYGDDVAKLAGNVAEYRRQLQMANSEAAKGSMAREAAAVRDSTLGQWQLFKNRLSQLSIVIGDVLLPPLNQLMVGVGAAATKLAEFAKANPMLTKTLVAGAAALGGLKIGLLAAGYAFTFLKGGFLGAMSIFQRFKAGTLLAQIGGSAGLTASRLLVLKSMLGMVGTTLAGIGAGPLLAIGAAVGLVTAAVMKFWPYIKAFAGGYFDGLTESLAGPFERLRTALSPIGDALGRLWGWFTQLFTPISATSEELQGATNAGRSFGEAVGSVIGGAIDIVTGLVNGFVWLGEAIGTAAGWITVTLGGAWEGLKTTVGSVIDWLLEKMQPLLAGAAWVGEKIGGTAVRLGLTDGVSAAETSANLPQPAMRGAGGGTTTNSTTVGAITVQAAPGQSAREVALEVDKAIRERERKTNRGAMYDPVAA